MNINSPFTFFFPFIHAFHISSFPCLLVSIIYYISFSFIIPAITFLPFPSSPSLNVPSIPIIVPINTCFPFFPLQFPFSLPSILVSPSSPFSPPSILVVQTFISFSLPFASLHENKEGKSVTKKCF